MGDSYGKLYLLRKQIDSGEVNFELFENLMLLRGTVHSGEVEYLLGCLYEEGYYVQ
jgi:hypothetical protein